MICPQCNCNYPDNQAHCPSCGTDNSSYRQHAPFTAHAPTLPRPPYPTAVELIKSIGRSKLYLVASIFYTIAAAMSVLSSSGADILSIVTVIAIWTFYSESKKDATPFDMSTSSLKTFKIIKTIRIVLMCISIAVVPLVLLGILGLSAESFGSEEIAAFVAILVITVPSFAFTLWLEIAQRRYFNSALESAEVGTRPESLPASAGVLMIVSGIVSAVAVLGIIIVLIVMSAIYNSFTASYNLFLLIMLFVGMISIIPSLVGKVLFGLVLLRAKKLSEQSYYPSVEEIVYYKREYYAAKQAAEAEAQARYQAQYRASYQQYQQTYGQNQGQQYQQSYTPNAGQQYQQPYAQPGAQQQQGQYQAPYGQGGNGNTQQSYGQQNSNDPW